MRGIQICHHLVIQMQVDPAEDNLELVKRGRTKAHKIARMLADVDFFSSCIGQRHFRIIVSFL